jgi:hypothetical protein
MQQQFTRCFISGKLEFIYLLNCRKNLFLMADRQSTIYGPDRKVVGLAMKTIFGTPGKDA